jgi:hypothetical protein
MNKELVKQGLKMNNINDKNIELFFEVLEKLEKLGDEYEDYDGFDDRFFIRFSIENKFREERIKNNN